jgi:hypothetical protein
MDNWTVEAMKSDFTMKTSKEERPPLTPNVQSRCLAVLLFTLGLCAVTGSVQGKITGPAGLPSNGLLEPGDIVFVDSGNPSEGGFIIKINPDNGEQTILSSGGLLRMPFAVVLDSEGQLLTSDSGRLIRLNLVTGAQTLVSDRSQGILGYPYGLGIDRLGGILVANGENIVNFDPTSGRARVLWSGQHVLTPLGVATNERGDIFAAAYPSQILRIHPKTGAATVLAEGGMLNYPCLMAIRSNQIYVTGVATPDGNFGVGRVVRVDCVTGESQLISEGGNLVGPIGIALEADGQILVADPYTINPESPTLYDGGIIRIDPATGNQTLLVRGSNNRVNPRGLMVIPGERRKQPRVFQIPIPPKGTGL